MGKIKCFFGAHRWHVYGFPNKYDFIWPYRKCTYCGKTQRGSYDMMYGETVWEDAPAPVPLDDF